MRTIAVKICGLTRPEDVALCHAAGVDLTGFIFAAVSPRRVTPGSVAAMPLGTAGRVGVFTEGDAPAISSIAREAKLDFLQLHGGQSVALCKDLGPERVIKVLWPERLEAEDFARQIELFAPVCAYFLFDSGASGGGSGLTLPWERLAGFVAKAPLPRPWILAGGLGPDTLGEALSLCSPWGVDCNSGVERAPGIKDAARIRAVTAIIKNTYQQKG